MILKTILFFANDGLVEALGWKRQAQAFPLIPVGGNTIIGHTLDLFRAYLGDDIQIIAPDALEVDGWAAENYPDLPISCAEQVDGGLDGEMLVINGRFLTNPNLPADLPPLAAITDETGVTRALWMKNGRLKNGRLPADDLEKWMEEMGAKVPPFPPYFSFPVRTIPELHYANTRLLGLGYGSEDLVERSYAEEFMGLPPVFLHETAVAAHSIIGPYAHIGANAQIKSSIIRNSIIGAGARIENCILDGAIIGENAEISGDLHLA